MQTGAQRPDTLPDLKLDLYFLVLNADYFGEEIHSDCEAGRVVPFRFDERYGEAAGQFLAADRLASPSEPIQQRRTSSSGWSNRVLTFRQRRLADCAIADENHSKAVLVGEVKHLCKLCVAGRMRLLGIRLGERRLWKPTCLKATKGVTGEKLSTFGDEVWIPNSEEVDR